jgi:HTH-type transcriptional regulator/antitoxin HigA
MSPAAIIDYPHLVSEVQPQVIHEEGTNATFIAHLRDLDNRWDSLSENEHKIHELLSFLIQDYERHAYTLHAATPIEVIEELMEANGLHRKDMVGIFETASVVSDVLNGKRSLTVDHIRRLSERFNVSPAVFF